jgi:2-haloacid dehalogenase
MLLVAAHPWDIDGAARGGMATAWVNRAGGPYPTYFTESDYTVSGIDQLADQLAP